MHILAIHGAGETGAIWQPQCHQLPDVRAIDLPGHGEEPGPGGSSIAEYADWVEERVGTDNVILAGHSMGGAIALEVALRRRSWVSGLLLVGTGARLRVHPHVLDLLTFDFAAAVEWLIDHSIHASSQDAVRDTYRPMLLSCGPEVIRADLMACDRFDVMDRLGEISVPATAIVGSLDRMTPPKYSAYLRDQMRKCDLEIVPDAGHLVTLEAPDAASAAMGLFARRIATGSLV